MHSRRLAAARCEAARRFTALVRRESSCAGIDADWREEVVEALAYALYGTARFIAPRVKTARKVAA